MNLKTGKFILLKEYLKKYLILKILKELFILIKKGKLKNYFNFFKAKYIAATTSKASIIITASLSSKFFTAASITSTAPAGRETICNNNLEISNPNTIKTKPIIAKIKKLTLLYTL